MHQFIKDTSGSALPFTGLAIVMLLASAALAVDMGYAYVIQTRLQGTADFAQRNSLTWVQGKPLTKLLSKARHRPTPHSTCRLPLTVRSWRMLM